MAEVAGIGKIEGLGDVCGGPVCPQELNLRGLHLLFAVIVVHGHVEPLPELSLQGAQ